mmetsp:Transcript_32306/g.48741  ORF Transcript_32306/g.48741 Transcript_32306/m.48741 type:complete len:307 (-) Transcript_32306:562-1482(-)|eukprot:CAMPEP_0194760366 /NCGR_PEP_ID=MMETSP0323_2-20130528/13288_1 /TAXON_ID=2866 ORGANISM="Crypthecodinium cohnii, Strain Seligo" /NCGR_SAMPLE_ID=MMETSP0323_2 /ASSEMBLY_ACC=CAM_ASM_000346 /LENGTH=306 /DNA_ID=CAMNT_0039681601 /DNA_START=51 /DNA_END=971 /DNA_ORIENTATION=+
MAFALRAATRRLLTPKTQAFARPCLASSTRAFAQPGYKEPDPKSEEPLLDSWVCPEALYEYALSSEDMSADVDEQFVAEFGKRNATWRERVLREDPDLFSECAAGQSPKYLWIGCSDSRVAAENMIDGRPGELFVHRNVANMVVNTDFNLRAVLKYAVNYLQVKHIIVCGHYDCGGVKAAFTNKDHHDPLESWLTNVRDVYRYHQEELEAIINDEERHKRFVELNIIEQCLNLFKSADVQRRRAETGRRPDEFECAYPRIHGMVFEPSDGILRRLPIDFRQYLRRYKRVYQMYDDSDFLSSHDGAE